MKSQENPDQQQSSLNLFKEFVIWFTSPKEQPPQDPSQQNKKKISNSKYDEAIVEIGVFHTILEFWHFYSHMVRPSSLPPQTSFSFFQKGVKPMWEDPNNAHGGRFMLRLKKDLANKCWEDLILAFIGDTFEESDLICGIQLNVKDKETAIAIWVKQMSVNDKDGVRNWIAKSIGSDEIEEVTYRDHPRENQREGFKDRGGGGGGRFGNFKKFDENKRNNYVHYEVKKPKENLEEKGENI